jgi:hypothetical protein
VPVLELVAAAEKEGAAGGGGGGGDGKDGKEKGAGLSFLPLTDELLRPLFLLLHGAHAGVDKIVEEFLATFKQGGTDLAADGGAALAARHTPSKAAVKAKVKKVAIKEKRCVAPRCVVAGLRCFLFCFSSSSSSPLPPLLLLLLQQQQ